MKKTLLAMLLCSAFVNSSFAQESNEFQRKVFNHVSANVSVGTEGIGFGLAAPVTNYLELEAGLSVMPGFNVSGDLPIESQGTLEAYGQTIQIPNTKVNVKGKFSRTTFHFKAHVYPFGGNSKFFMTAGCSFGGRKIAKVSGHSDDLQQLLKDYPDLKDEILNRVGATLGDYNVKFNDNADIIGDIRCNGFRPYLGLGYGRLIPKHRVGVRVELGCQFMGHMKVYQNDEQVDLQHMLNDAGADDDLSKFVEKWTCYPVLKVSLVGRIL